MNLAPRAVRVHARHHKVRVVREHSFVAVLGVGLPREAVTQIETVDYNHSLILPDITREKGLSHQVTLAHRVTIGEDNLQSRIA
jgi:hypothetical protein